MNELISDYMNLDFRKLIELLKIDAPTYFTPREQLNKANYVFCQCISNTEKDAIIINAHATNNSYDSNGIGLHFPDITVEEYYELERNRNPVAINLRINSISNVMTIPIKEFSIIFSTYCVLHEYGHWIHFESSKMTPYEYCLAETNERKPYEKMAQEIYNIPDWHPMKKIYAEKYDEIYSNFSSESFANQYALKHIETSVITVRDFLDCEGK